MIGPRIQTHHRLRIARENANYTRRALADVLGTNTSKIDHWESGRDQISPYELTKLAAVCGVDYEWITDGELIEFRDICPVCKQDIRIVGLDRKFADHSDKAGRECPMGARQVAA